MIGVSALSGYISVIPTSIVELHMYIVYVTKTYCLWSLMYHV